MNTEGFPAIEQRVRMILEGPGASAVQLPVTVTAASESSIRLRVAARPGGSELGVGAAATLEYVRGGAVYRMRTEIALVEENGASVTLRPVELKKIQRRRHTRVYVSMPVEFSIRQGGRMSDRDQRVRANFSGRVRQMGTEGCAMLTDLALGQGDSVRLALTLEGVPLAVDGQVVWTSGPGTLKDASSGNFSSAVGIAFEPMDPDTRGHLDNFLLSELKRRPS